MLQRQPQLISRMHLLAIARLIARHRGQLFNVQSLSSQAALKNAGAWMSPESGPRDSNTGADLNDTLCELQVEALDEVERAFVHVDYKCRDEPEHKVERNLRQGARNLFTAHDSVRHQARTDCLMATLAPEQRLPRQLHACIASWQAVLAEHMCCP